MPRNLPLSRWSARAAGRSKSESANSRKAYTAFARYLAVCVTKSTRSALIAFSDGSLTYIM
jgi:hypothetical protein